MLPRFQRMEAWGHREITDLLNNVVRGLPVGSVLILEVGDELPFVSRVLESAPEVGERVTELLLDGQQRLTALWRALNDTYEDRTYYVEFPEKDSGEISAISLGRWEKNGKRYPVWADSPSNCWERRLVPMRVMRPGDAAEANMDAWVAAAVVGDHVAERDLSRQILRLRQKFAGFNIPFLSLPVETPKEVALEVFIKMNTRTVRLTTFDIIVAQTEESTSEPLHDLVEGLASTVPGLAAYDTPEDVVLNVMALLQDRPPNQAGYLGLNFKKMVKQWPELVKAAQRAVSFLEQEMVFDNARLPTESVLAPVIALWSLAPDRPDAEGNARILLRKYLWRSFFTDRYERAAATAALQDYRALRDVLTKGANESAVPCFDEDKHALPATEALIQAGWPKKRDRLARAVLLVSFRGGGHDIADDTIVTRAHLERREYHHLYPVGFLKGQGSDESYANRALNCALISWKTNRAIAAKEPLKYLQERANASRLGETEIRRRLASHAIDYDGLAECNYDSFLKERAKVFSKAIRDLCDGKPWKSADK